MGVVEDYLATMNGQQKAKAAARQPGDLPESYTAGLVSSTVSGLGETFGMKPFESAETFRAENPVAGFVSEMTGAVAPWFVGGALSATARGSAMLEGAMGRLAPKLALTAETTPIRYGMVKEAVRYSPVEISRLGIGLGTTETWDDYGNLLADVGLSTLITGGFGGIGGFFRAGGKAAPELGRVVDADLAFAAPFEYRMARSPNASFTNGAAREDVENRLFREVWTERPLDAPLPGQGNRYVNKLEGGNPETDALMNTLFRPSGEAASKASLYRQPLMKKDGTWALDDAARTEMLAGLGFKSIEDLAEVSRFPRMVTVNSESAAGTISKALDESAMQVAAPGVLIGKEAQGGLYVVAKRLDAPQSKILAETGDVSAASSGKIAAGDRWFITKTDKPQLFAPTAGKWAEETVNRFAKYRAAFQPDLAADDIFSKDTNLWLEVFSPADVKDIAAKGIDRATKISRLTEKVNKRVAHMTDLQGSYNVKHLVEQFYDVMAPQVMKEGRDTLYARLFGVLRSNHQVGVRTVNKIIGGDVKVVGSPLFRKNLKHDEGLFGIRPVQAIINGLDAEERVLLKRISDAQAPLDTLEQYTKDGLVSANLKTAVTDLQNLNKQIWEQHLLPAIRNAGMEGKFDLLEGYIMPRIFKGDWFVPVVDDAGRQQWLASGSLAGAKKEAQAVIDEGAKQGIKLTMDKPRGIGQPETVDAVNDIHNLVQMQLGKSSEMQDIVQRAMKKMAVERAGMSGRGSLPKANAPRNLEETRTGMRGTPDIEEVTVKDLIDGIGSHYSQLYKFAAHGHWRNRWLSEADNLKVINPTLAEDLTRKANQFMGYEGKWTNAQNQIVGKVLGPLLGQKAATKIAQETNALMANWNLMIANPTFALLNVLSPLQTVMPHVAFLLKAPNALVEKDMHMILRYGADGKPRAVSGVLDPPKIMMRSWKEMGSPDPVLLEHYSRAKTDSTLTAQMYEGFVGGQSRAHETLRDAFKNAGGGAAGSWETMKRGATFMAERSEELSRVNAFTTYHILGRDYFGLTGDALYRFAQRGTHNSMFGYSVVDRSRMFTGPIGSMFGLFKNWQLHFINSMFQYAGLAVKQGQFAPMLWQFGVAGAVGGVGSLGPLKWVADGIAKMAGDGEGGKDTAFTWLQENWHDSADEIYFGLPALLGTSLQASASLPGTDVRNDLTSLSSLVFIERMKKVGQTVGEAWDYQEAAGQNPIRDPNIRDKMLNAFAPRAVFRAFASAEGDYIKSMATGAPSVRDVGPLSKVLYGLGLNQVEVEQQQVASKELWKDQERRRTLTQQLGIRLADAQLNGDWEEMERVQVRAISVGIEPSKVYKSAMTRLRRETEGDSLSRYDAERAEKYLRAIGN